MKLIDPLWFFISLSVGILLTYLFQPEYNVVIKYPHPNKKNVYQDLNDNCYKYIAKGIKCPLDISKVKEFKIQH